MNSDAIHVIGGGFGGLAGAITLASKGRKVVLHEKQDTLGGKANTRKVGPFRFDTGPSLLTMVEVFRTLFAEAGKDIEAYIPIVELSPLTHYWFADGTRVHSDRMELFIPTLTEHLDVTEDELKRYFAYAKRIWDTTHGVFLEKSLHSWKTFASRETLHSLARIGSIDALRSMHKANASFFRDPRLVQLFDRYATYNGSDPYQAPATLNTIAYVEHGLGGYGVTNGIYGIIEGLERLARELGVEVRTGSEVSAILHDRKNRITGLVANGEEIAASLIISDVDVSKLYSDLLNDRGAPLARRYRKLPPSSSALVFYWGIDRECKDLGLHNILFSSDYLKEFEAIHTHRQIPDDPTIYLNITSKITPTDAPVGGENWFVLVNAPPHDGRSWHEEIAHTRSRIVERLSLTLGFDLEQHIAAEECMTPADIETQTGSYRGSLYGISSNTTMAAFLRHPNRSKRYTGLYLAGGSVHPGGGMPLATLSGVIAAHLLLKG
ncbi:MAG: phytoene desaturase family protein [Sphaerochaeta sp.]|nr:phytoene desaturase family protein [Sphaerochaeta sp.]